MKFATKRFLSPDLKKIESDSKKTHRQDPSEKYIDDLSQKLDEILNDKNLSDAEKVALYNTLFQKYLATLSKDVSSSKDVITPKDASTTKKVSKTINKSFKKNVVSIMNKKKKKEKKPKNVIAIPEKTDIPKKIKINDKFNIDIDNFAKLKSKIDKRREEIKSKNKKYRSDILNKSRDIDKTLDNFETPYTHAPVNFYPKNFNAGDVRKQLDYDDNTSILSPNQTGQGFIWHKRNYF